jgi:hypothetical protein
MNIALAISGELPPPSSTWNQARLRKPAGRCHLAFVLWQPVVGCLRLNSIAGLQRITSKILPEAHRLLTSDLQAEMVRHSLAHIWTIFTQSRPSS